MCYQILELYSACRCLYYQHAVDRCSRYGKPGHGITNRTILVGYACLNHANLTCIDSSEIGYSDEGYANRPKPKRRTYRGVQYDTRQNRVAGAGQESAVKEHKYDKISQPTPANDTSSQNVARRKSLLHPDDNATRSDDENGKLESGNVRAAPAPDTDSKKYTAALHLTPSRKSIDICDYANSTEAADAEESSSDESVTSETRSILSVASSTTTVDSDATEAIFRRLLLFQDLRYLWPQLVFRCGSRSMSVKTLERMLRRFSEDLARLTATMQEPDSSICLAASQFVRRVRLNIAYRIWETHREAPDDHGETGKINADLANDDVSPDEVEDDRLRLRNFGAFYLRYNTYTRFGSQCQKFYWILTCR